jgi:zinc/manganese transport system substrate-binding protein
MKSIQLFFTLWLSLLATATQARLEIFTCEPEWASLASELGADKVNVFSATTGTQDPHHIEARPALIAKIRRADLLICTGAELEAGWLPLLLSKSGNAKIQPGTAGYFIASDYVKLLNKPVQADRSEGDIHLAGNPHIQTSAPNIALVATALHHRLLTLDNNNQATYSSAYENFMQRWRLAMTRWEQQAAPIKQQAFAVDHQSWVYLAHWLHLDMDVTLEPKPGIPPSTRQLAEIQHAVKQKNIRKIIYAAYASPRSAQWLAEKTSATAVELPFTVGGNSNVKNLFDLFDQTLNALVN